MNEPTSSTQRAQVLAAFEELGAQAARTNLVRRAELDQAIRQATAGTLGADGWQHAKEIAHQLAGSAGTFGHPNATALAHQLEDFFAGQVREPAELAFAQNILDKLTAELSQPPQPLGDDG